MGHQDNGEIAFVNKILGIWLKNWFCHYILISRLESGFRDIDTYCVTIYQGVGHHKILAFSYSVYTMACTCEAAVNCWRQDFKERK